MDFSVVAQAGSTDPVDGFVNTTEVMSVAVGQFIGCWVRGASDSAMTDVVVTDSNGQTLTPADDGGGAIAIGSSDIKQRFYWIRNATLNAAYVLTGTMPGVNPVEAFTLIAFACTGHLASGNPIARYGGQSQTAVGAGTDNFTTGSLTSPGTDGCLLSGACGVNTWPDTFGGGTGYTAATPTPNNPSTRHAYATQTTAAAFAVLFSSDDTSPPRGTTAAVAIKPAASGAASVTPDQGALALSGQAPTILVPLAIVPGDGQIVLTGQAPTITAGAGAGVAVQPAQGQLALAGLAGGPRIDLNMPVIATQSFVAEAIAIDLGITPDVGALILTGQAPTAIGPVSAPADVGLLVLAGQAPIVGSASLTVAGVGLLLLSGQIPGVNGPPPVTPGGGDATANARRRPRTWLTTTVLRGS